MSNLINTYLTHPVEGYTEDAFVSQWQTTTASESITIPIGSNPSRTVDFTVDWGDGSATDSYNNTTDLLTVTHTYADAGIYDIVITPNSLNGWKGIYFANGGDKDKIIDILQWGNCELEVINFYGCSNLTGGTATDYPDVSSMTSLQNMFRGCNNVTITNWDQWQPYQVSNFQACFRDASINGGHASWITSNAVDLDQMYLGSDFNQDWSTADFSNVNSMSLFSSNNTDLSTANIDIILNKIASQAPGIQSGVTLDFGTNNDRSSASNDAMILLVETYSWTISVNYDYTTEYQAVIDEATTQTYTLPSLSYQIQQDDIIKQMKSDGSWATTDFMMYFIGDGDADFKLINWKNPAGTKGVETGAGSLTFASDGVLGDGTNYINLGWNPVASVGLNYLQNDFSISIDVISSGGDALLEGDIGVSRSLELRNGNTFHYIHDASMLSDASGIGFLSWDFLTDTAYLFKNGSNVDTEGSKTTVNFPTTDFNLLKINTSYGTSKIGSIIIGASLNGSGTEHTNLYNAIKGI